MAYKSVTAFQSEDGNLHDNESKAIHHDLKGGVFFTLAGDERFKAATLCFEHADRLLPIIQRIVALQSEEAAQAKRNGKPKEGIPPVQADPPSDQDDPEPYEPTHTRNLTADDL